MDTLHNWLAILLTGFAASAPQTLNLVPAKYQPLTAAIVAAVGAIYTLYRPAPK